MERAPSTQNRPRRKKNGAAFRATIRRQAAFTLTEVAIVLAISGVIIGTIWAAAGTVWENYKVTTVMQQVIKSADNLRDNSVAIQQWPAAWQSAGFDITKNLDGVNLLPVEMRSDPTHPGTTNINHALNATVAGGSFHVVTEQNTITSAWNIFRIELQGLSQSACVKFLMNAPLGDTSVGIVQLLINGTSRDVVQSYTGTGGTPVWNPALPFTPATVNTWCNLTTSTNEVDLDFRLHN